MSLFHGQLIPRDLYVSDHKIACFGTDQQPAGTSSYYSRYFKFDATTPSGKNMLATLLMAMDSAKRISVWYDDSVDAGKTEVNGATEGTIATLRMIGIH